MTLEHYAHVHGPMRALGLQRDPSRAWTHVMFQELEYTPDTTGRRQDKFRVMQCGVFKMEDIREFVQKMLGWTRSDFDRCVADGKQKVALQPTLLVYFVAVAGGGYILPSFKAREHLVQFVMHHRSDTVSARFCPQSLPSTHCTG